MNGWSHPQLASSWEAFCHQFCLDMPLGYTEEEVSRALGAIERYDPARYSKLSSKSARGVSLVAPTVERGLLIATCENCEGVPAVIARLVEGERSAYAEIVLGFSLVRLGYSPRFGAACEGKVLDLACECDGITIFFEVAAPERSDQNEEDMEAMEEARKQLSVITDSFLEVELLSRPGADDLSSIINVARLAPPNEWIGVRSVARLRKTLLGQPYPSDADRVQVRVGGDTDTVNHSSLLLGLELSPDERAKRVFNDERHHFSARTANVLVLDVCAVNDGLRIWPGLLRRLFQPTRNQRVGAALLFDQGVEGPPERIRRRWCGVNNPHAHVPIPPALLAGMSGLTDSLHRSNPNNGEWDLTRVT